MDDCGPCHDAVGGGVYSVIPKVISSSPPAHYPVADRNVGKTPVGS